MIGRYAFAVYDEGGLLDINLGGFPTYASLTLTYSAYSKDGCEVSFGRERNYAGGVHAERLSRTKLYAQIILTTPLEARESRTPITFKHNVTTPQTFAVNFLPHGLSIDPSTGTISGIPTSPGTFTIRVTATNACGTDTLTLNLTINGRISTWLDSLAGKPREKGNCRVRRSHGSSIRPARHHYMRQINKLMGWRNYATTQQSGASFDNPSFPPDLTHTDYYAKYFLGAFPPPDYVFTTPFTTVSAVPDRPKPHSDRSGGNDPAGIN